MNVKNIKKGFTLTELIIVIVIIGILAGVLIPTFINVVNKANKAADLSLIRNLNEALTLDRYDNGEHKNMTQALKAADDYGFAVDKIDAKVSKNKILWDSENDVFCYLVGDDTLEYYPNSVSKEIDLDDPEEDYLLWIIDNKVNSKFSTYLYGYSGTTSESDPLVANGVGLDTGKCDVAFVKYVNTPPTNTPPTAKNVVIRTNSASTTLTVNAPTDTVRHYDSVGSVNIIAVANASYHENGNAAFLEIAKGRVALEKDSKVNQIHINTKVLTLDDDGEIETKSNTEFDTIIISKDASVEMPEFSRDPVEINEVNGTLVVALQDGTEAVTESTDLDYVWLTAVGVYEQVTVSDNKTSAGTTYAASSETVNDEKKEAAQQIANKVSVTVGDNTYEVKASKTVNEETHEEEWTYSLVGETEAATEAVESYTVTIETLEDVTVTNGETQLQVTVENGLDEHTKEATKVEAVADARQAEEDAQPAFKIGNTGYVSLEEVFENLSDNSNATIILNKNIVIKFNKTAYITIKANQNITIDLNGYKIEAISLLNDSSAFIKNLGTLTLMDSKASEHGIGDGSITLLAVDPDNQDIPAYASNIVSNYGVLVIDSGIYDNQSDNGYACYALDNYSGGTATINGGNFIQRAAYTYAVRMFPNSTSKLNKVVINDGIIEGGYAFWLQSPNDKANLVELEINGGTFIARDGASFYAGGSSPRDWSNTSVVINGGNIGGLIVAGVPTAEQTFAKFEINGGIFTSYQHGNYINITVKDGVDFPSN